MRETFLGKKDSKNNLLKKTILRICIEQGEQSIASFSEELNASVPTVTKLIGELMDEGFIVELGKWGTSGGRRPSIYGLNPDAGVFVGVDIRNSHASISFTDFKGNPLAFDDNIPFVMERKEESVHRISKAVRDYAEMKGIDWDRILGMGISLAGRVNCKTGYSNKFSFDPDRPINKILEEDLMIPVIIENDSRAMTYGEYLAGVVNGEKNVIFVNVSWGLGMGLIMNGQLFYGTSGYSGEFGHFPLLDNDIICRCGKVGCLETGASGSALVRMVTEQLKAGRASSLSKIYRKEGSINIRDIFKAISEEDVLAIDTIGEIGNNLGRGLAGLINVFNPELVVIGGKMVIAGDYLMLPVKTTMKKFAQNIAIQDTNIKFSSLRGEAASRGDCLLSRSHLLGVL